ncbi:MAG TPA: T9SS type A sorting domain-containing protein [Bacteroidetes bacterium]|nr:T9SS type A sorting domain-containing protein [Bacteroidota bacterium]
MKKQFVFLMAIMCLSLISLKTQAQIPFSMVITENTYGSGSNQLMCVVDFDSDSVGIDSSFAWILQFDGDSLSGDSILNALAFYDSNFSVDIVSGFLNNISYTKAGQTYTNPNIGWFAIYESADGQNWNWNGGLTDSVGNMEWIAFVVMDPSTFQADINVPMCCSGIPQKTVVEELPIYPNPAKNIVYIPENGCLKIYSLEGSLVFSKVMEVGILDISFLPAAIYQLILTSDKKLFSASLIKE